MISPRIEDSTGNLPAPPSGQVAGATDHLPRIEPGRWFGVLFRRGWLLIGAVALAVGATGLWIAKTPKTYRSHGSVYVSTEAPRLLDIRAVAPEESRDLEQLRSVADGMLSSTLLLRVIESNELAGDGTFPAEVRSEQGLLEALREAVTVELRRGTRIIDITVDDTDPERARLMVDSIKTEYENWTDERREALTSLLSEGLAQEEGRLRQRMEESAAKLQSFRELNAVPGLEAGGPAAVMSGGFESVRSQLTRVRAERLRLEAEVEAFQGFDRGDPDALAGLDEGEYTSEVLALMRSLRDKQTEFARIKERYLHKHPVYREIASEVNGLEGSLSVAVRSAGEALQKSYRVAKENEGKLVAEVEEARGRVVDAEGIRAKFATLSREAEADRELHATVSKRLRETSLAASAPSSILRWEETPLVPEKAAKPRKAVLLGVATCGGMVLGLLLILGAELSDRRLRSPEAAARVAGVPVLAQVPEAKVNGNGGMVIASDPGSNAAEAFRRLRAVLGSPANGKQPKTILFTSTHQGEGSSFCALNYAGSLAMQGYRTLLIDADMRSAGVSRESAPGLGDYLAGDAQAADGCLLTDLPKLCMFASGKSRSDAAELLAGTRFPALLEDAYRWFDRVVIDAPAVMSASDVQTIARYANHTCLVVHSRSAERRSLRQSVDMLRASGAGLAGIVWNGRTGNAKRGESCYVEPGRPAGVRSILGSGDAAPAATSAVNTPPMPTIPPVPVNPQSPRNITDLEVA